MTKYPAYIKQKAIELRREKQLTVDQIADQLKIAKSTAYEWTKHVSIPRTNSQTAAQRRATERSQAKFKKIRDDAYAQGLAEAPELMKNPLFRDFVNLYIAEGAKTQRHYVDIGNSDKAVIKLSSYWLKKFKSPERKVLYFAQIHEDHNEDEIKAYWANVVDTHSDNISITRKSNSNKLSKRQFRSEYGVLSVRVCETTLHSRVKGWMDYLKDIWLNFETEL